MVGFLTADLHGPIGFYEEVQILHNYPQCLRLVGIRMLDTLVIKYCHDFVIARTT